MEIDQNDFNREMESYLSSRENNEPVKKRPKRRSGPKPVVYDVGDKEYTHEENEFYSIHEPWYQKIADFFIGKPKAVSVNTEPEKEMEMPGEPSPDEFEEFKDDVSCDEPTKKEAGFFKRILSWFVDQEEDIQEDYVDVEPENTTKEGLPEGVKRLIKIQHHWMEQLPSDVKNKFKTSEDYVEYTSLLKEYHLIK